MKYLLLYLLMFIVSCSDCGNHGTPDINSDKNIQGYCKNRNYKGYFKWQEDYNLYIAVDNDNRLVIIDWGGDGNGGLEQIYEVQHFIVNYFVPRTKMNVKAGSLPVDQQKEWTRLNNVQNELNDLKNKVKNLESDGF